MEKRIEIPAFVIENTKLVEQKAALRREREAKIDKRNYIIKEILETVTVLLILTAIAYCVGCGIAYCFDTLIGQVWLETPTQSKAVIIVSLTGMVLLGIGNLFATKVAEK